MNEEGATSTRRSQRLRAERIRRILAGLVTMALLVAAFLALSVLRLAPWLEDSAEAAAGAREYAVSQTQTTAYCPARMTLPDAGSYGDSAYQSSQGDIASAARYAAFGSVLQAQVSSLDGNADNDQILEDADLQDQANVKVASGNADHGARLFDEHLLKAATGSGSAGSVASWATTGDLKGLSAASCVRTGLSHSFLLPATHTGITQQLVVANPSAKATSLQLDVRGTEHAGTLTLSTGRTLSVAAHGQVTLDLSAAAPRQDGLFVTVSSKETPIAAVVRVVSMEGLTSKGSDFAVPVVASRSTVLDGLESGDKVTVFAYSRKATALKLQWLSPAGVTAAGSWKLDGGKVAVITPSDMPSNATSLVAAANGATAVQAMAANTVRGGSADFAFLGSQPGATSSAVAMPDKVQGRITLSNPDTRVHTATMISYDGSGRQLDSRKLELGAETALNLDASDLGGDARLLVLNDAQGLHWGVRLSQRDVDDAKLAGVATLSPQPLEPQHARVRVIRDPRIVR